MGTLEVNITANARGPLFDGRAPEIVHAWLDDVKQEVAQEGVNDLRSFVMDKTGRATGHYQSMVTSTVVSFNDVLIHDPVIYGPWLEGTSKRNESTRFKGYRLWRITRDRLRDKATQIAERRLPELIARLGGR